MDADAAPLCADLADVVAEAARDIIPSLYDDALGDLVPRTLADQAGAAIVDGLGRVVSTKMAESFSVANLSDVDTALCETVLGVVRGILSADGPRGFYRGVTASYVGVGETVVQFGQPRRAARRFSP